MTTNHTSANPIRNTPGTRAELTDRLKEFHRHVVKHSGREQMLKIYCNAICTWATDPNTDLYHVERLLDEIQHASRLESLDDWDDEQEPASASDFQAHRPAHGVAGAGEHQAAG